MARPSCGNPVKLDQLEPYAWDFGMELLESEALCRTCGRATTDADERFIMIRY